MANQGTYRVDVKKVKVRLVVKSLEGSNDLTESSLVNCEQENDSRKLGFLGSLNLTLTVAGTPSLLELFESLYGIESAGTSLVGRGIVVDNLGRKWRGKVIFTF